MPSVWQKPSHPYPRYLIQSCNGSVNLGSKQQHSFTETVAGGEYSQWQEFIHNVQWIDTHSYHQLIESCISRGTDLVSLAIKLGEQL